MFISFEVRARIAASWGKFHQMKHLLCRRRSPLEKRLRLFDARLGQTVLCCPESWLISDEKHLLNSAQNCMQRRSASLHRAPVEEWLAWIRAATHIALEEARKARIRLWLGSHLRSKWTWAGHVQSVDRRSRKATVWWDSEWWREELMFPKHSRTHCPH